MVLCSIVLPFVRVSFIRSLFKTTVRYTRTFSPRSTYAWSFQAHIVTTYFGTEIEL